jgi:hypothetical protein
MSQRRECHIAFVRLFLRRHGRPSASLACAKHARGRYGGLTVTEKLYLRAASNFVRPVQSGWRPGCKETTPRKCLHVLTYGKLKVRERVTKKL